MKIEYEVRPVTRYIVTKFISDHEVGDGMRCSGGSETQGEFDSYRKANIVCEALYKVACLELEEGGDSEAECFLYEPE